MATLLQLVVARAATAEPTVPAKPGLLALTGRWAWEATRSLYDMLAFTGESASVLFRSLPH